MDRSYLISRIEEFYNRYKKNIGYNWVYISDDELNHMYNAIYGDEFGFTTYSSQFVIYTYEMRFKLENKYDHLIELFNCYPYSVGDPFNYFIDTGNIKYALKCHQYKSERLEMIADYYYDAKDFENAKKYYSKIYKNNIESIPKEILQDIEFEQNECKFYIFTKIRKIELILENIVSNRHLNFIILNYLFE